LAFERRAWGMRLRWSELWGSLKVITILGLFSGIWLFPWGWILLAFFFVYVFFVPSMIVYFVMFLVFGGPLAFISSIFFFVSERIPQRDSRFLRSGWFTSTSCAHTVFIAGIDNQPIRFSISIWPLLETGP